MWRLGLSQSQLCFHTFIRNATRASSTCSTPSCGTRRVHHQRVRRLHAERDAHIINVSDAFMKITFWITFGITVGSLSGSSLESPIGDCEDRNRDCKNRNRDCENRNRENPNHENVAIRFFAIAIRLPNRGCDFRNSRLATVMRLVFPLTIKFCPTKT